MSPANPLPKRPAVVDQPASPQALQTPKFYVAEPPARYHVRPPMVVDCSALCAILFDEPAREHSLQRLIGRSLHAPNVLDGEVTTVALHKQRAGWPVESVALAISDYAAYYIVLHSFEPAAVFELAMRYDITTNDAAYLWLAAELKAPLATFDPILATAAQAHLGALPDVSGG